MPKRQVEEWNSWKIKPEKFALIMMKLYDRERLVSGWWTGSSWFSRRKRNKDHVEAWTYYIK